MERAIKKRLIPLKKFEPIKCIDFLASNLKRFCRAYIKELLKTKKLKYN